jgi:hypothetical protein
VTGWGALGCGLWIACLGWTWVVDRGLLGAAWGMWGSGMWVAGVAEKGEAWGMGACWELWGVGLWVAWSWGQGLRICVPPVLSSAHI